MRQNLAIIALMVASTSAFAFNLSNRTDCGAAVLGYVNTGLRDVLSPLVEKRIAAYEQLYGVDHRQFATRFPLPAVQSLVIEDLLKENQLDLSKLVTAKAKDLGEFHPTRLHLTIAPLVVSCRADRGRETPSARLFEQVLTAWEKTHDPEGLRSHFLSLYRDKYPGVLKRQGWEAKSGKTGRALAHFRRLHSLVETSYYFFLVADDEISAEALKLTELEVKTQCEKVDQDCDFSVLEYAWHRLDGVIAYTKGTLQSSGQEITQLKFRIYQSAAEALKYKSRVLNARPGNNADDDSVEKLKFWRSVAKRIPKSVALLAPGYGLSSEVFWKKYEGKEDKVYQAVGEAGARWVRDEIGPQRPGTEATSLTDWAIRKLLADLAGEATSTTSPEGPPEKYPASPESRFDKTDVFSMIARIPKAEREAVLAFWDDSYLPRTREEFEMFFVEVTPTYDPADFSVRKRVTTAYDTFMEIRRIWLDRQKLLSALEPNARRELFRRAHTTLRTLSHRYYGNRQVISLDGVFAQLEKQVLSRLVQPASIDWAGETDLAVRALLTQRVAEAGTKAAPRVMRPTTRSRMLIPSSLRIRPAEAPFSDKTWVQLTDRFGKVLEGELELFGLTQMEFWQDEGGAYDGSDVERVLLDAAAAFSKLPDWSAKSGAQVTVVSEWAVRRLVTSLFHKLGKTTPASWESFVARTKDPSAFLAMIFPPEYRLVRRVWDFRYSDEEQQEYFDRAFLQNWPNGALRAQYNVVGFAGVKRRNEVLFKRFMEYWDAFHDPAQFFLFALPPEGITRAFAKGMVEGAKEIVSAEAPYSDDATSKSAWRGLRDRYPLPVLQRVLLAALDKWGGDRHQPDIRSGRTVGRIAGRMILDGFIPERPVSLDEPILLAANSPSGPSLTTLPQGDFPAFFGGWMQRQAEPILNELAGRYFLTAEIFREHYPPEVVAKTLAREAGQVTRDLATEHEAGAVTYRAIRWLLSELHVKLNRSFPRRWAMTLDAGETDMQALVDLIPHEMLMKNLAAWRDGASCPKRQVEAFQRALIARVRETLDADAEQGFYSFMRFVSSELASGTN